MGTDTGKEEKYQVLQEAVVALGVVEAYQKSRFLRSQPDSMLLTRNCSLLLVYARARPFRQVKVLVLLDYCFALMALVSLRLLSNPAIVIWL